MPPITPQPRPKFATWLFERRISNAVAAEHLKCSAEHVRRIGLPYSDEAHTKPSGSLKQRIATFTDGDVGAQDWAEPEAKRAAA